MQKTMRKNRLGMIGILLCWISLFFMSSSLAQEKTEPSPCPKPYIKLIKPKLAKAGQQVTIRGRRFGSEEEGCGVLFQPGLNGKIISWRNNRIEVGVPAGVQTGKVIVKTKCSESNGVFFKVAE